MVRGAASYNGWFLRASAEYACRLRAW